MSVVLDASLLVALVVSDERQDLGSSSAGELAGCR